MNKFINLKLDNIVNEHICCIIRSKSKHEGIESKKKWLKERLKEGHVFRKLNEKATVFIEYAPLEKAWVPIDGNNYYYIYCLWTLGNYRNKGYGKELLEYCINDAKEKNKSGICFLGSVRQKAWLTNQDFMKKLGFKVVDKTESGYELLALSFDNTYPKFCNDAKNEKIDSKDLTIYYSDQCPYIYQAILNIKNYCSDNKIPLNLIKVDSLDKAKKLPCVFNNWALFYNGKFITVNLLDVKSLSKIIEKN